jgi:hypothetical protein
MQTRFILLACVGFAAATEVSPVQKVLELLDECKAKVAKDLAAETAVMEEYTTFCDDELKEKGYAIETAGRELADLSAAIEKNTALGMEKADEIATLGSTIAAKETELASATKARASEAEVFAAAEKELVKSVDEASRAYTALSKGMALMQGGNRAEAQKQMEAVKSALNAVIGAVSIKTESKRKLKSFLQQADANTADDELTLKQPQAKMVAYESKSGGILSTIKDMQEKAEAELSDLRKKEMSNAHNFGMIESGLNAEIAHSNEKLGLAKSAKSGAEESLAKDTGSKVDTSKAKAADEEYSATLKTECETTAMEWSARQKSAKEEMAAIDKASEILTTGVVAFAQVGVKHLSDMDSDDDDTSSSSYLRSRLSDTLTKLGKKYHSFALMQLAGKANSDPFVKIRGLIEEMMAKLLKEAQEEASQKAFCDKEMGESTKSQEIKTATIEKLKARMDEAATTIATLQEAIKTLEAEIADIDKAQSEATAIRTKENTANVKAMSDFKQSADAVIAAIGVLKSFYEGALIQTKATTQHKSKQPSFGSAKTDAGSGIISVLEVAESDFTRLYAETETEEDSAAAAYEKLSKENGVAKATKETDAKAKASEIKSLTVSLDQHTEDHSSTSDELDAVNAYIDKLKPQCESKVMSYAEKKAAREAEIAGLKEALSILEGKDMAFLSIRRH